MRTAIVIGAGPAGLAPANHLADAGVQVTVLERRARTGGRAGSDRYGPLLLNQGPALYLGGAGARELARLGIRLDGWNPVAPFGSFFLTDPVRARRTAGGARATAALARFLVKVIRAGPVPGDLDVSRWLDVHFSDERARAAAAAAVRVTTFVADHDHFSASAAAAQLRSGLAGVRYLGSWQRLIDALELRAGARGASVIRRSAARAVRPEGGDGSSTPIRRSGMSSWWSPLPATGGRASPARGRVRPAPARRAPCSSRRHPRPRSPAAARARAPVRARHERAALLLHPLASRRGSPHRQRGRLPNRRGPSFGSRERLEAVADLMQPGWRDELVAARYLPRMTAVP